MYKTLYEILKNIGSFFLFLTPDKKIRFEKNAFKVLSMKVVHKFRLACNPRFQLHTTHLNPLPIQMTVIVNNRQTRHMERKYPITSLIYI